MISARLTWVFLNLICALSISAQATKVRFDVTPSKQAKLELDGKDLGLADGQKLTLGFNVRKGIESTGSVNDMQTSIYHKLTMTFNL
jgi:hypothetical protein